MTPLIIGTYTIHSKTVLAPMVGVSDLPFRKLCRHYGAGLTVSEMVASKTQLRNTHKSRQRIRFDGEPSPRVVQIVGTEPEELAEAAKFNVDQGADIIDINMGCPAKKVCKKLAGSALLKDEKLVAEILHRVVSAVSVPVTLKIRTGWSPEQRNGVAIAHIAEDSGIQALAVHGRTRACRFKGEAEYNTIKQICDNVKIPVIANGDINSPEKAKKVLDHTGATCIMIGRGAQGRPWLFKEINYFLNQGKLSAPPSLIEQKKVVVEHLDALHHFYGSVNGVKIARKHISWYTAYHEGKCRRSTPFRREFNQLLNSQDQRSAVRKFYDELILQEINTA